MKLNINSNSAQLYRWFYGTSRMPESLCPYFWKLVLMWTFILPYSILSLPVIIMERLDRSQTHSTGERAGLGFIVWFVILILIGMVSWFGLLFVEPVKNTIYYHLTVIGFFGWVLSLGIGITTLYNYLVKKYKESKIKYDEDGRRIWNPEPKQDSIIVSFIKASYNKYCPRIDWRHKDIQ
jgi:hypothetical protein